MRQLALYIIFLMSMVFTNYGKASSVPETLSLPFAESSESFLSESSFSENQFIAGQHSESQDSKELFNKESHSEDRLTQIEHKQNKQDAQLKMLLQSPIAFAAIVHSDYCQMAISRVIHLQVDCFLIKSSFYLHF